MTVWVALLRAVNVGGTGKLPMTTLTAMCEAEGFSNVKTYIASGNVVFASPLDEAGVKAALESRLHAYAGKPVGVLVRTAAEMAAIVAANPFAGHAPNRTVTIFLDTPPPVDWQDGMINKSADELVMAAAREFYISYGSGMAGTKLRIKAAAAGTARNMNTVSKLAAMAAML